MAIAKQDWSTGTLVNAGKNISDLLLDTGKQLSARDDIEFARKKAEEAQKYSRGRDALADTRYQTEEDYKTKERAYLDNARVEEKAKAAANQNAMQAVLTPGKYGDKRVSAEQAAIQSSLANLSPEERVVAEKELKISYDADKSKAGWLTNAVSNSNVDQGLVLNTQNAKYLKDSKDVNSQVYKDNLKAQKELIKWQNKESYNNTLNLFKRKTAITTTAANKKKEKAIKEYQVLHDALLKNSDTKVQKVVGNNQTEINNINANNSANKVITDKYKDAYSGMGETSIERSLKANIARLDTVKTGPERIRLEKVIREQGTKLTSILENYSKQKAGTKGLSVDMFKQAPVPELTDKYGEGTIDKGTMTRNILETLKTSGIQLTPENGKVISEFVKTNLTTDKAAVAEAKNLSTTKNLLKTKWKVSDKELAGITTYAGAKDWIATLKAKKDSWDSDKGIFADSRKYMDDIGTDTTAIWFNGTNDFDAILAEAETRKIKDSQLKEILEGAEATYLTSGSARNYVIKTLKEKYKKKKETK